MLSLPGRLYGPGLPGAGVPVEARLDALQETPEAALSFLETRADVDASRHGAWGISYGGFTAIQDAEVQPAEVRLWRRLAKKLPAARCG